jgi:hypothetical protein
MDVELEESVCMVVRECDSGERRDFERSVLDAAHEQLQVVPNKIDETLSKVLAAAHGS